MSGSAAELLIRWHRDRVPARIYVALAGFLTVAALAGRPSAGWSTIALSVSMAYLLVLQFRLWDDLGDRESDRREHPDRVLPSAASVTPFRLALAALSGLNIALIALLAGPGGALVALVALNLACAGWYLLPARRRRARPAMTYRLPLIRYPVFVYVLGSLFPPGRDQNQLMSLLLVYFCFSVYEVLHDPGLRSVPGIRWLLAGDMIALAAVSVLMMAADLEAGALVSGLLALLAGGIVLAALFRRYVNRLEPGAWPYAIFVIGLLELLFLSRGARI